MTIEITIIGLGQVGASIGLALAASSAEFKRTGYDEKSAVLRQAEKIGAIDRPVSRLDQAVKKADLVILAVPADQIRSTLESMAPQLGENTIVLDTSQYKSIVSVWAKEILPNWPFFVTFTPGIHFSYLQDPASGIDAAHGDLFKNSPFVITGLPGGNSDAIQFAVDLAGLLGGKPMFADPLEADGLFASTCLLPRLSAAALLNATTRQPGWGDGFRLAGVDYFQASAPVNNLDGGKELAQSVLLNRENAVRVLNNLIFALVDLRDAASEDDAVGLEKLLKQARQGREDWWSRRVSRSPDLPQDRAEMPKSGDTLRSLLVGGFGKPKPPKK